MGDTTGGVDHWVNVRAASYGNVNCLLEKPDNVVGSVYVRALSY